MIAIIRIIKRTVTVFLLFLLVLPTVVFAYSDKIMVGGETIGIEIKTNGVLIVGTYFVDTNYLAADSGIKTGDVITNVNDKDIYTVNDLISSVDEEKCETLNVTYSRNNKKYDTVLSLKKENNLCKTGLYVKDSVTGIGTLTYIDPNTKIFGALGHEITERTTGKIIETKKGTIFDSEVINIQKSSNGVPGEKTAKYYSNRVNGTVSKNTNKGIFGEYSSNTENKTLYKVAKSWEIHKGEAKIRTVLSGSAVKEYSINITKISDNQTTKNLVFEITDKNLLDIAGGIVQGMSGSPIIQGDNIIGAVTHVVVDNPTKGYGIFITTMLEEGENN